MMMQPDPALSIGCNSDQNFDLVLEVAQIVFKPMERLKKIFFSDIKFQKDGVDMRDIRSRPKAGPDKKGDKASPRQASSKPSSGSPKLSPRSEAALDAGHLKRERVEENSPIDKVLAALKVVLGMHSQTRNILRHLTFVESAMMRTGFAALDEVPAHVLELAIEQFEALVINISDPSLGTLRAKMANAMTVRENGGVASPEHQIVVDTTPSDFMSDDRLIVKEATFSNFMDAEKEWQLEPAKGADGDGELSLVPLPPKEAK